MSERNYDNTGMSTASRYFVKLDAKQFQFTTPAGTSSSALSGYLNSVDLQWREKDGDLPNRWEAKLNLSTKIDGEVRNNVCLNLSSHWTSPVFGAAANSILGALESRENWKNPNDRLIFFSLKKASAEASGRDYCKMFLFGSNASGDWLGAKFPFSEKENRHEGVPTDKEAELALWISAWREIVYLTGGNIIGEEKANGNLCLRPIAGSKFATAPAPTYQPAAPAQGEPSAGADLAQQAQQQKAAKFKAALAQKFEVEWKGKPLQEVIAGVNDLMRKITDKNDALYYEKWFVTMGEIAGDVNRRLGALLTTENLAMNPDFTFVAETPATPPGTDDLPF